MSKVPTELLAAEKSLAAFTAGLLKNAAAGLEFRAQFLAKNQESLKAQPEPDPAAIAQAAADLAAAKAMLEGLQTFARAAPLAVEAADRVVSVSVSDAAGLPASGLRVRLSGKDLVVETVSDGRGNAQMVLKPKQLGSKALGTTFAVEVLDSTGKVVATSPEPITIGDENLLEVAISLTPPPKTTKPR